MKHLYNSKITFQESSSTGKDQWGSEVISWVDISGLINIPCRINWLVGQARGESFAGDKVTWIRDAKVYLGYYSNLTTKMRLVYNSENYDIVNLANVDEKNQYMVLFVKKEE